MDIVDYRSKGTYPRRDLDFIYIMVGMDHHDDPVVEVYSTFGSARIAAQEFIRRNASGSAFPVSYENPSPVSWLFYGQYGNDGQDYVYVFEGYINQ